MSRALVLAAALTAGASFAAPCPADLPVLFVVQDKSGSMNQPPDPACPTCPTKWVSSRDAVTQLASNFGNRFRFGVMTFPALSTTFNCTTGTTVLPVPSTPAQIAAAYSAAAPGGGTSTASSLVAARYTLQGLALTEPAYVLLLTDGLPNCNFALNPATCTATTPGCANDSCGLGAKDCLDDTATSAAAAALLAAGYKVYVVGFGTGTAGNKTVLDAVAAAGGTGASYAAANQAALTGALNAIGYDATTCCKDACPQGATRCTGLITRDVCQLDVSLGCTNWAAETCPSRSSCQLGACQSCADLCTVGALRCNANAAERCEAGPTGCSDWVQTAQCTQGQSCAAGACASCVACTPGASRCAGLGVESCLEDAASGCSAWVASACAQGSACSGGACAACNGTCTAGAKRCSGNDAQECVADASGCTTWQTTQSCTGYCSGGACNACGTVCTVGAKRCNGTNVDTCAQDANGCNDWRSSSCALRQVCNQGACLTCATHCTSGEKRCAAAAVEECAPLGNGCYDWKVSLACAAGQVCSQLRCQPGCHDTCTLNEVRCATTGEPLSCEKSAAGCNAWVAKAACEGGQTCAGGVCASACGSSDALACDLGYSCEATVEGPACLPLPGAAQVKPGCGCSSGGPVPLALLAAGLLALAAVSRRRPR